MEPQERQFNFFRFEDLRIYHKSLDYVKWVYSSVANFPQDERTEIGNNIIKASTTISVFIAEGSGRNKSQFVYYLNMAKSSIRECLVLSTIAHQNELFTVEQEEESRNFLIEISKMIGALIASLIRSRRPEERERNNDQDDNEGFNKEINDSESSPNMY